jgi:hypothetical protein
VNRKNFAKKFLFCWIPGAPAWAEGNQNLKPESRKLELGTQNSNLSTSETGPPRAKRQRNTTGTEAERKQDKSETDAKNNRKIFSLEN